MMIRPRQPMTPAPAAPAPTSVASGKGQPAVTPRDVVKFTPKPVAQAKEVKITLPTIPQAVGGVLGGVAAFGATAFVGLGMGFGGMAAAANLVIAAGWLVGVPLAAYGAGKLAGKAWDAMTK